MIIIQPTLKKIFLVSSVNTPTGIPFKFCICWCKTCHWQIFFYFDKLFRKRNFSTKEELLFWFFFFDDMPAEFTKDLWLLLKKQYEQKFIFFLRINFHIAHGQVMLKNNLKLFGQKPPGACSQCGDIKFLSDPFFFLCHCYFLFFYCQTFCFFAKFFRTFAYFFKFVNKKEQLLICYVSKSKDPISLLQEGKPKMLYFESRKDLRKSRIFTIDPTNSKDFDDALSTETIDTNKHRIGVHIADVSHFVRPGTLVDAEARNRATS
ncbi:ribonuclease R, partial [Reticulomyxa filosa]